MMSTTLYLTNFLFQMIYVSKIQFEIVNDALLVGPTSMRDGSNFTISVVIVHSKLNL
jgi:hypothetical protein